MSPRDSDRLPSGLRRALRLPGSRRRVRADVDAELRFHIEERIEELMAAGKSRNEAEREVHERFGDLTSIEEACVSVDDMMLRRHSLGERFSSLWRDVRYALRGLARRPLYSAVIVVTIALAIGANTAIFSVVDAVLLHPLPVRELDRVVAVMDDFSSLNLHDTQMGPVEVADLTARRDVFETVAGSVGNAYTLTRSGSPQRVSGAMTLGDYFGLFGVRPLLGRFYRPDEGRDVETRVVVLTYGLWQEVFGGDAGILGKSLELEGRSYEVIGVAPAEFQYPITARFWVPYYLSPDMRRTDSRGTLIMSAFARLKPGITLERAGREMHVQAERWTELYPSNVRALGTYDVHLQPFVDKLAGEIKPVLIVLMGAVVFVLLIACANVGSLQLVRANGRERELAVRAALGAGRWSIGRQLLIESLVLAVAGGTAGVGIAYVLLRPLASLDSARIATVQRSHLHGGVLAFTAIATIVAGVLFGIAPALRAARVNLQEVIKDSTRGASAGMSRHRFLQASVTVQVALTLMLLLGSALTIRSLSAMLDRSPGFTPEHVMTMRVSPQSAQWTKPPGTVEFFRQLADRMRTVPGVQTVGVSCGVPFAAGCTSSPFKLAAVEARPGDPERHALMWFVTGDYFRAMGIALERGRTFGASDNPNGPLVAIIDDQLADHYFHGENPIGKRIEQGREAEIIGVVHRVDRSQIGEPPKPIVYYAYSQAPWWSTMMIVVRSTLAEATVTQAVRAAAADLDPRAPVHDIKSMPGRIDQSLGARRLAMNVLTGFAALSLVLAVLGIYGVLSYSTSQRTQEIGIRMALGAEPGSVARMVLGNGLALTALGAAVGTIAFLGVGRLLGALLYGIGPRDPATIAGGVLMVIAVAAVASYLPARRAARVDPVVALRE